MKANMTLTRVSADSLPSVSSYADDAKKLADMVEKGLSPAAILSSAEYRRIGQAAIGRGVAKSFEQTERVVSSAGTLATLQFDIRAAMDACASRAKEISADILQRIADNEADVAPVLLYVSVTGALREQEADDDESLAKLFEARRQKSDRGDYAGSGILFYAIYTNGRIRKVVPSVSSLPPVVAETAEETPIPVADVSDMPTDMPTEEPTEEPTE